MLRQSVKSELRGQREMRTLDDNLFLEFCMTSNIISYPDFIAITQIMNEVDRITTQKVSNYVQVSDHPFYMSALTHYGDRKYDFSAKSNFLQGYQASSE